MYIVQCPSLYRKQESSKSLVSKYYSSDSINLVPVCEVRVDMVPPENWRSGLWRSSTEPVAYGSGDPLSARGADDPDINDGEDGERESSVWSLVTAVRNGIGFEKDEYGLYRSCVQEDESDSAYGSCGGRNGESADPSFVIDRSVSLIPSPTFFWNCVCTSVSPSISASHSSPSSPEAWIHPCPLLFPFFVCCPPLFWSATVSMPNMPPIFWVKVRGFAEDAAYVNDRSDCRCSRCRWLNCRRMARSSSVGS